MYSLLTIHSATVACFWAIDRDQEAKTKQDILILFLLAVNQCMNEKDCDKLAEMCTPTLMTMFRLEMPHGHQQTSVCKALSAADVLCVLLCLAALHNALQ